jgi:hypothetical protein
MTVKFRRTSICLLSLIVMTFAALHNPAAAQENSQPIYIAEDHAIWAIDSTTQEKRQIFTLAGDVPLDTLSENERNFRQRYADMTGVIGAKELFSSPTLSQDVHHVWEIASGDLALLVETGQCSHDTNWRMCAGYYALQILNIESSELSEPIFTFDYHDLPDESEWECDSNTSIVVEEVIPNPTYDAAVIHINGSSACYDNLSYAILANYRAESPFTLEIFSGREFVWSPDGTILALISEAACFEGVRCQPFIQMLDHFLVLTGVYPGTSDREIIATPSNLHWLDDHTLQYELTTCNAYQDTPCGQGGGTLNFGWR